MSDDGSRENRDEHPDSEDDGTHGSTEPVGPRETAPMDSFTARAVGVGIVVLAVGLLVTVAIPIVFV